MQTSYAGVCCAELLTAQLLQFPGEHEGRVFSSHTYLPATEQNNLNEFGRAGYRRVLSNADKTTGAPTAHADEAQFVFWGMSMRVTKRSC